MLAYNHRYPALYSATKVIASYHRIPPPFFFYLLLHLISVLISLAIEIDNSQISVAYNQIILHKDFGLPVQSGPVPHVFSLRPRLKEQPLSGLAICMVLRAQRAD